MAETRDARRKYDALLLVSFGGPEKRDDVIPFLENVLRGRNVPRERMLEVAEHYYHYDGVSPINAQCRDLLQALEPELRAHGVDLPVYWGNRNWHPFLPDTIRRIKEDGHRRVLAFVTSGFSCYSGCRQYRENLIAACDAGPAVEDFRIDKIRVFYNHPDFIAVTAEHVRDAIERCDADAPQVAFTAHSIPDSMANSSDYVKQLTEACRLTAEELGLPDSQWKLVYQSRSGRPQDPWLEPDICDYIGDLHASSATGVVVVPVGFLSDHMEVIYDLDDEARTLCDELKFPMVRAATPGIHPRFVSMVRKLIQERSGAVEPEAIGHFGANHDVCPQDCCPAPKRPGRPAAVSGPTD